METLPLRLGGERLVINADAHRGVLRVALLEADGRAIPGFELIDNEPLRKDATAWTPIWRGGAAPRDRAVRVVISFESSRLFSIASR